MKHRDLCLVMASVGGVLACRGGGEVVRGTTGPTDNQAPPAVVHPAIDVRTLYAVAAYDAIPRAARVRPDAVARYRRAPGAPGDGGAVDAEAMRGAWWPVIDTTDLAVRVASRDDDTVVAVWIERASLATSIITPVALRRAGVALPVTLHPGAEVEVGAAGQVTLVHPHVVARGEVDAAAIGDVFDRPPQHRPGFGGRIERDVEVWPAAAPVAGALPVAGLRVGAMVRLDDDAGAGARRAVTFVDALVEVRGFVERAAVAPDQHGIGTGSGHGIGASHAQMLPTPAGTCLLASDGDEVVGITLVDTTRHAYPTGDPRWWRVLVWTPWSLPDLRAEDERATGDVTTARLRSCRP